MRAELRTMMPRVGGPGPREPRWGGPRGPGRGPGAPEGVLLCTKFGAWHASATAATSYLPFVSTSSGHKTGEIAVATHSNLRNRRCDTETAHTHTHTAV